MSTQYMTKHDSLRRLRSFLGKTQREMAAIAGCSTRTIVAVELGSLSLSPKLALKISEACGVDFGWLTSNDANAPIISDCGGAYTPKDFQKAQERDQTLAFWHSLPEMEIYVAAGLLRRVYRAARAAHEVSSFSNALKNFVQEQVHKFPKLRDEVQKENAERNRRHRKVRPYLWPSSSQQLKHTRKGLNEVIASITSWERRSAALERRAGD
jgi:transcriptional regulator with XRE-family HTH domain